jgi:hypothetical protein
MLGQARDGVQRGPSARPVACAARCSTKCATLSLKSSLAKLAGIWLSTMGTASRKDRVPTVHHWRLIVAIERGDTVSARSSA